MEVDMGKTIAVVGMGCIFPDAMDISEYWNNIVYGVDSVRNVPDSYWSIEDYYDTNPNKKDKTYSKKAGIVGDTAFDAIEFGIAPNDLESISVEQIFALVVAKQALIDARMYGENAKDFNKDKVGVILASGIGKTAFSLNTRLQIPKFRKILRNSGVSEEITEKILEKMGNAETEWTENSNPGYLPNVVAGRVAGRFNLCGTNCTVDAACAGSFAALKYAVNELNNGDCDAVLTGAVNLDCSEFSFVSFSKTPAMSRSDCIKPYDQNADGMLLGDGVGMVVLKRLEDAEQDGNQIYGLIKGIGASGDGRSKGIFSPNVDGQMKVLRNAYKNANVDPSSITLIEGHGTGTKIGDENELKALTNFFENRYAHHYIGLGSVKSQIGHTRIAAGIASLIKVMLALYHSVLPGTLHVENKSAIIKDTHFNIVHDSRAWIVNDSVPVRRAGISAFGFGGTNYHVVVEEYKREQEQQYRLNRVPQAIILSGNSIKEIIEKCQRLKKKLILEDDNYRTKPLLRETKRIGFIVSSKEEAIQKLDQAVELLQSNRGKKRWCSEGFYYRDRGISSQDKVVTLFSGAEKQYIGILQDLTINYPEMREAFSKADNARIKHSKKPISQCVYPFAKNHNKMEVLELDNVMSAAITIQSGILKVLENRGFFSDNYVGWEIGQITSLWAEGKISEECLMSQAGRISNNINFNQEEIENFDKTVYRAHSEGAKIFVEIGIGRELSERVERILDKDTVETISTFPETHSNSYMQLEYALMQMRVLGLPVKYDKYYRKLDGEIEKKLKHSIRVNPRIFRTAKKEAVVREAVYGKREVAIETSTAKEEDGSFGLKDIHAKDFVKLLKNKAPSNVKKIEPNLMFQIAELNFNAYNQTIKSQKLIQKKLEQIMKSEVCLVEKQKSEDLINLHEKHLLASYREYMIQQREEGKLYVNTPLTMTKMSKKIDQTEKTKMRIMKVVSKKISSQSTGFCIKKGVVIITLDNTGIAKKLYHVLIQKGFTPVLLNLEGREHELTDYQMYDINGEKELEIAKQIKLIVKSNKSTLTGFIYISSINDNIEHGIKKDFEIDKKLFLIAKYFYLHSEKKLNKNEKKLFFQFLRMDGKLGVKGRSSETVLGGLFGLGKALNDEWEDTLVKTIDIQRECDTDTVLQYIVEEIFQGDSHFSEMGRDIAGGYYTLGLDEVENEKRARDIPNEKDVFFVTGGGHGITAQCIIRLAQMYQCRFVILGRTVLNQRLELGTGFKSKEELQKAIIEHEKGKQIKLTPKQVAKRVNSYYAQMEIRETLREIEKAGGQAYYYSSDVMKEDEVKYIIEESTSKVGNITGFIYGAGTLADKYIHNKSEKDFQRVAGTKILGLDACINSLKMDEIRFTILFSSIAAFFGNRGQSDYAIGNEVLNKVSYNLKKMYPGCKVLSVNWGPWNGGMINEPLKRLLAGRDVSVISVEKGIEFFMDLFKYDYGKEVSQVVVYDKRIF